MGEILMVRHGQANAEAQSEEDYDRLSPLGFQQAEWLGAYLADHNMTFDRVVSGTLRRHRETRTSMGLEATEAEDARLNELSYFPMADAMERQFGVPVPRTAEAYATHVPQTLAAWKAQRLKDIPEEFSEFQSRTWAVLEEALARPERTLFVTSGGVITMVLSRLLDLSTDAFTALHLQIHNSSFHGFHRRRGMLHLGQFNATPHLAHPDRQHALTYV